MKDLLFLQQREVSLRAECEYCGKPVGEICVNPKSGRPLEHQPAHFVRIPAGAAAASRGGHPPMINVETSIEPPTANQPADDEDEHPAIQVRVSIIEADYTGRACDSHLPGVGDDDEQVADALIACLRGLAANRGPGLVTAVEGRLR